MSGRWDLPRVVCRLAAAGAVLLSCQACLVASLHPAYDDASIVFDEALLGTWDNRENEVRVVISRGEWRSYHLAYTDRFGTTKFTGHVATLGTARFLNLRPEDGLERPAFLVAANGVLQLQIEGNQARVREPDYAVATDRLRAGTLRIGAATDLKQNVLITAPTPRLRAWLAASLRDEALWADWKTFVRSPQ